MPSGTPPEPPSPSREFLSSVDAALREAVTLHCLGGFVMAIRHGLPRPTNDVDFVEIVGGMVLENPWGNAPEK